MLRALAHRGPDDEGVFEAAGAILGHRRLSIIDLALGHQPIIDPATGCAMVFNGEIYNYQDLRRVHSFPTRRSSDLDRKSVV